MAEPDLTGARILLAGHAEPTLVEATREACFGAGGVVTAAPEAPETGPTVDVAIIFARRPSPRPMLDTDDTTFEAEIERQLLAPQRAAIAVARSMAASDGGVIVLVGSVDAFHAYPGRSVTSISMGATLGLTRAIAIELAGRGVRANLVVCGPLGNEEGEPLSDAPTPHVERTLLRAPSHRLARPSEVAAAILFVAGPDAAFMTGQTLRVDGGWASLNQAPEGMRFP